MPRKSTNDNTVVQIPKDTKLFLFGLNQTFQAASQKPEEASPDDCSDDRGGQVEDGPDGTEDELDEEPRAQVELLAEVELKKQAF